MGHESIRSHCVSWIRNPLDIRRDSPTACRTADVQGAFLKGKFQDKDRVLYCLPPRNGPDLRGVQPGSLLLVLKEFLD